MKASYIILVIAVCLLNNKTSVNGQDCPCQQTTTTQTPSLPTFSNDDICYSFMVLGFTYPDIFSNTTDTDFLDCSNSFNTNITGFSNTDYTTQYCNLSTTISTRSPTSTKKSKKTTTQPINTKKNIPSVPMDNGDR